MKDIYEIMIKNNKFSGSYNTFSSRVKDYFGNFKNMQLLFLKPMLETLVKSGFDKTDINKAYGQDMRNKFLNLFEGRLYEDLKNLMKKGQMDWSDLQPYEKDIEWTIDLIDYTELTEEIIEMLIIKYYAFSHANQRITILGRGGVRRVLNRDRFARVIQDYFPHVVTRYEGTYRYRTDWDSLREEIAFPVLFEKLRAGWSGRDAWDFIGYQNSRDFNKLARRYFNGLSTEQLRDWLMKHPTVDSKVEFEELFIAETQKSTQTTLTRTLCEDLLFKHRYLTEAILDNRLKSITMKELKAYLKEEFGGWREGKKYVFSKFLISSLKNLNNPPDTKDLYLIMDRMGYTPTTYPRVFKNLLGCSAEDAYDIVMKYPSINDKNDFSRKLKPHQKLL
ncbi:MAG: hypothetical protein GF383_10090 [Candidatus Lokiarchaeota archaeon]|nr:hypothetical protein [Candidatus Lokiarchaeota archaeon]MBD3340885.1 hypothetical protein [Candidatus Lokiarchaeota archaeon]